MKAILEFDLEADADEFNRAVNGSKAFAVLWAVDRHLQTTIKHGELSEPVEVALQGFRDYLHQSAAEHGITIG